MNDYIEARFFLACTSLITAIAMHTQGLLNESNFVTLMSVVLGLYSAHSLADDKLPDR
jgi:hypothetical protein